MPGLIVVAAGIAGCAAGGTAGWYAALRWADMNWDSLDAVVYVVVGGAVGATAGVFAATQLVA